MVQKIVIALEDLVFRVGGGAKVGHPGKSATLLARAQGSRDHIREASFGNQNAMQSCCEMTMTSNVCEGKWQR
ncbi:hypothetical protein EGR_11206 [Echinococcus granulosus]|uniref:Uncharacterized protein n=1 Tax=Echinococcus granulosus TaxID=6210 RepID=W6U6I0_ECHGR|nr:hypothetical protein EGR_11206 [Echinococcus granulosus]EUB53937.1 hypothetical protein EGR_11206 [Echinococcus granulosus]